LISTTTHD